ncbi:fructose-bisphosphate aldolase [Pseudomonas gingeri]|uniref:fructose-bisphosphate aldolase n=1 Tax=Pseudomonas gingeri TaxID=117681 RepID=UPI0015A1E520|nr:fructose-bisphosphate aldolase [Pseudomonas gingeri]NWA27224.1 fructose-bisphosphate aldolase [Pseudomonas gingeri]NWD71062.1 fructose-bisphosphate aldolase [Pseudomonas gingeri]
MHTEHTPRRFIPMDSVSTEFPVLYIDRNAPLVDLHACVSERMRAVNKLMTLFTCSRLSDSDPRDLGNIASISRLLLQDASDVFDVIETRGLEAKHLAL